MKKLNIIYFIFFHNFSFLIRRVKVKGDKYLGIGVLDHLAILSLFICIKIYEAKPFLTYTKISIHDLVLKLCMSTYTLFLR
jgi:hypothetical protein